VEIPGVPEGTTEEALLAEFRGLAEGWAGALEAWEGARRYLQALDQP
jgi:hypothetical protein